MVPEEVGVVIAAARRLMTGGEAVAEAMRQIDPDVVPVYPITPQTPIIQGLQVSSRTEGSRGARGTSSPSTPR